MKILVMQLDEINVLKDFVTFHGNINLKEICYLKFFYLFDIRKKLWHYYFFILKSNNNKYNSINNPVCLITYEVHHSEIPCKQWKLVWASLAVSDHYFCIWYSNRDLMCGMPFSELYQWNLFTVHFEKKEYIIFLN